MKTRLQLHLLTVLSIFLAAALLVSTALAAVGDTTRVSVSTAGVEGNDQVGVSSSISADGRYVAFMSFASNMVSGDTIGKWGYKCQK